jgi:hypothetical protein
MSVNIVSGVSEYAPGDIVALTDPTLVSGPATALLDGQQPIGQPPNYIVPDVPVSFSGSVVIDQDTGDPTFSFQLPDGSESGDVTITDSAGNVSQQYIRVVTRYLTTSEYSAQGQVDTEALLLPGELDAMIRQASALIDGYLGRTLRLQTYLERHRYENGRRKLWPYHLPINSVSSIAFVTAPTLRTNFNVSTDIYFDPDSRYVDILAFSIGNYELLGMLEHIGFSANVIELVVNSGYDYRKYPSQIRAACTLIVTKYLNEYRTNKFGLGGLVQTQAGFATKDIKGQYVIPPEVATLLNRFFPRSFR